jgi:hypothetical protein
MEDDFYLKIYLVNHYQKTSHLGSSQVRKEIKLVIFKSLTCMLIWSSNKNYDELIKFISHLIERLILENYDVDKQTWCDGKIY